MYNALKDAVWNLLARGRLTGADGSRKMRVVQTETLAGDLRDGVEHFEPYGYTSEPFPGAETLVGALDGDREHSIVFCVADRRYRMTGLKAGEVAIFDDQGQCVHLTRDGIVVKTAKTLTLQADAGAEIKAPSTHITGTLQVDQKITGTGGMAVSGGGGATVEGDVVADGISLKSHTHQGDSGGSTGTPR